MSATTNRLGAMRDHNIQVAAVCYKEGRSLGYIVMDSGMKLKITTFIDEFGERTRDPDEAWYVVAGRDSVGWITYDLANYWMPSYEDH